MAAASVGSGGGGGSGRGLPATCMTALHDCTASPRIEAAAGNPAGRLQ